ncbi:hypothetical protein MLD52_19170 [Puniceicoccaceae bacterium K14]|nr:hypothetical protein [Puniceicoccaceae bacterium K14]
MCFPRFTYSVLSLIVLFLFIAAGLAEEIESISDIVSVDVRGVLEEQSDFVLEGDSAYSIATNTGWETRLSFDIAGPSEVSFSVFVPKRQRWFTGQIPWLADREYGEDRLYVEGNGVWNRVTISVPEGESFPDITAQEGGVLWEVIDGETVLIPFQRAYLDNLVITPGNSNVGVTVESEFGTQVWYEGIEFDALGQMPEVHEFYGFDGESWDAFTFDTTEAGVYALSTDVEGPSVFKFQYVSSYRRNEYDDVENQVLSIFIDGELFTKVVEMGTNEHSVPIGEGTHRVEFRVTVENTSVRSSRLRYYAGFFGIETYPGYRFGTQVYYDGSVVVEPDKDSYEIGDVVTATIVPDEGSRFVRWEGDIESDSAEIQVTIGGHTNVNAILERSVLAGDTVFYGYRDNPYDEPRYFETAVNGPGVFYMANNVPSLDGLNSIFVNGEGQIPSYSRIFLDEGSHVIRIGNIDFLEEHMIDYVVGYYEGYGMLVLKEPINLFPKNDFTFAFRNISPIEELIEFHSEAAAYKPNSVVSLSIPEFDGDESIRFSWSGDVESSESNVELTMDSHKTVYVEAIKTFAYRGLTVESFFPFWEKERGLGRDVSLSGRESGLRIFAEGPGEISFNYSESSSSGSTLIFGFNGEARDLAGWREINTVVLLEGVNEIAFSNTRDATFSIQDFDYEVWQRSVFSGEDQADESISGRTSDPDGDGISNESEQIFSLSPLFPDELLSFKVVEETTGKTPYLEIPILDSGFVTSQFTLEQCVVGDSGDYEWKDYMWQDLEVDFSETIDIPLEQFGEGSWVFRWHYDFPNE